MAVMTPPAQSATESPFYVTGGTLLPDAPSYVARAADEELFVALSSGETCYVLNARQMGKSSLCVRTQLRLKQAGIRTAFCDLQSSGGKNVTAEQWYIALLSKIGRELGLLSLFLTYWKEHAAYPPVQRLFGALSEIGLNADASPIVVFIDEIDVTLSLPFSTDEFFAAIRQTYVGRATDANLKRLSFCLLGTASPADLIQDVRVSPFNIGKRIELRDFTASEAIRLADGFRANETSKTQTLDKKRLVNRILYWTGGHPFLTQRLCLNVKRALSSPDADSGNPDRCVDKLCSDMFLTHSAKESDDNFAVVRNRLLRSEAELPALLDMYRKIHAGKVVQDDETNPLCSILKLSGVTKVENGRFKVRNRIYATVFDAKWVESRLPDAENLRQKAAYRQGVKRTVGFASAIIAGMAGLLVFAIFQRNEAQFKTNEATIQKGIADKSTLVANDAAKKEQEARRESERHAIEATKAKDEATSSAKKEREARQESDKKTVEATKARDEATAARDEANREKGNAFRSKTDAEAALESKKTALGQVVKERNEKQGALAQANRLLYPQTIQRAERALEQGDSEEANRLLSKFLPSNASGKAKEEDPRGFEWQYLNKQAAKKSKENPVETLHETSRLENMSVSPNGKRIATANAGQVITLWEGKPFQKSGTLKNEDNGGALYSRIKDIQFLDDGKLLLATTYAGDIYLWDAQARKMVQKNHSFHNQVVGGIAFDKNSRTLATGTNGLKAGGNEPGGVIEFWKLEKDNRLSHQSKTITHTNFSGNPSWIMCLAYSPDGSRLASGGTENQGGNQMLTIRMWETSNLEPVGKLEERGSGVDNCNVTGLSFSPDGKWLASSNGDDYTRLFKLPSTSPLMDNDPKKPYAIRSIARGRHSGEATCVTFAPDSAQFASGGKDANIKFWNVSHLNADGTLTETTTLLGHASGILRLAIPSDSEGKSKVVSCSDDGAVNFWNPPDDSFKQMDMVSGKPGWITQLAYSPDRKWLATAFASVDDKGSRHYEVQVFDSATHRIIANPVKDARQDLHIAISPNSELLAIGGNDRTLRLWNANTRSMLPAFEKVAQPVEDLSFSPDGKTLATCASGSEPRNNYSYFVREWDVADRSLKRTLKEMKFPWDIECVAYSPDGRWLAGGGGGGEFRLFNLQERRAYSMRENGAAIVPPGSTPAETDKAHRGAVITMAFSPDGKILATGSHDHSVKLWNMDSPGSPPRYTLRMNGKIQSVSFSLDGKTLGVRSENAPIRFYPLYSLPEGLLAESVSMKGDGVTAFAFGPDTGSVTLGNGRGAIQFR